MLGGLLILPGVALPALGTVWPMHDITLWVAEHVFGLMPPLNYRGTSGDTAFHWVQTFWICARLSPFHGSMTHVPRRYGAGPP